MLTVMFDEQMFDLDVPDKFIIDSQKFYEKMDCDMDKGWQVSREWISNPDPRQRCQIVAEKILHSFHEQDEQGVLLMAGYILSRATEVKKVSIDTSGDISCTEFSS